MILMCEDVAKIGHIAPRDVRRGVSRFLGEMTGGVGQLFEIPLNGIEEQLRFEGRFADLGIFFDPLDAEENIATMPRVAVHKVTASRSASALMSVSSICSVTTSTSRPRSYRRSSRNPLGNHGLWYARISTRKSMSLPSRASSRTTEPNTRTFAAPCR
jgi:hypothetical protein